MFLIKPYLVQPAGAITRASTATYTDASGVLKYAIVDEVRPIIETTASTNLLPYSSSNFTATNASITQNNARGPDAVNNSADYFSFTSTTTPTEYYVRTVVADRTVSTTGVIGCSIYLKSGSSLARAVGVELLSDSEAGMGSSTSVSQVSAMLVASNPYVVGEIRTQTGVVSGSATSEVVADGWIRLSFKANVSERYVRLRVYAIDYPNESTFDTLVSDSGPSESYNIQYFGAQIEANSVSSYIPTNGSTATRAADIVPVQPVGTSELLSSNVAFNDYSEWAAGTAYVIGNRVIVSAQSTNIYEAIANSTGVNPTTDTTGKWLNIGAVNRWRMFDSYLSTKTTRTDSIEVAIRPGYSVDTVSLINVVGKEVRIIITDPQEGEVFNQVYDIYPSSLTNSSWYSYFFETPTSFRRTIIIDGIPRTGKATVTVMISNPGLTAEVGLLLVGKKQQIGDGVEYGTTTGIVDYSVKQTDQFGNTSVVERAYADRLNYKIYIKETDVYNLKSILASVRSTPCLYVGNKEIESTISYGYYKNFDIALQHPSYSDYNLEIEGLT